MSEYEKMSLVELEMELDRVERCKFMINMADHLSRMIMRASIDVMRRSERSRI